MTVPKKLCLVTLALIALICVLIFGDFSSPAYTEAAPGEKKAELQEQLAEELHLYYLGEGSYQKCQELIEQIEQLPEL